MKIKRPWSLLVAGGIVLVLGAHAEAQMAKQGTYAGNFGWYAIGKTFELEKDHAFWVGEFSGTFFNETGQGFLHGTSWVCPGVNDLTNGASTASQGYCVVTDKEGDKAFLVWKGGKGFEGTYQWTGGTGKYTGIKGNNTFRGVPLPPTAQGYGLLKGEWQLP